MIVGATFFPLSCARFPDYQTDWPVNRFFRPDGSYHAEAGRRPKKRLRITASAPSPVTLHAVPKLSIAM